MGDQRARARAVVIAVGEVRVAAVGRARVMGRAHGVIRVYGRQANGRLLGCEMVGPAAST